MKHTLFQLDWLIHVVTHVNRCVGPQKLRKTIVVKFCQRKTGEPTRDAGMLWFIRADDITYGCTFRGRVDIFWGVTKQHKNDTGREEVGTAVDSIVYLFVLGGSGYAVHVKTSIMNVY